MIKKIKLSILVILLFICVVNTNLSIAGFADFTDEDAKQTTEKMIEEQAQNFDATKSNNNYLKSLKVENFELNPEFDKQTLEYYVNIPDDINEINIEANADDENAKVDGNGKVEINTDKVEYRIDVTAESGTVRTYIIKRNNEQKNEEFNSEDVQFENNDNIEKNTENTSNIINFENNDKEDIKNKKILYIVLLIILLLIITYIVGRVWNRHRNKII